MSDSNSTISGAAGGTGSVAGSAAASGNNTTAGAATSTISGAAGGTGSVTGSAGATSVPAAPAVTTVPTPPTSPVIPAVTTIPPADPPSITQPPSNPPPPTIPTPPPPPPAQSINDARQLANITQLLNGFKTRLDVKIGNDAAFRVAATDLSNVVSSIVANPTKESLDFVWSFFVDNANGVCQETMALKGVEVLAAPVRQVTELVYTLFRKATKGINVSDPTLVNQNAVRNIVKSPKLIAYLVNNAKTVVVPTKT